MLSGENEAVLLNVLFQKGEEVNDRLENLSPDQSLCFSCGQCLSYADIITKTRPICVFVNVTGEAIFSTIIA